MRGTWLLTFLTVLNAVSAYLEPEVIESSVVNSSKILLGKRSAFSGMATWYDVETWKAGACGQDIDNSMHIVALNEPMYGSLNERSNWCGKKIMIANGLKTAKAVIMDACPQTKQCHHGSLDMSMSLFQEFHHLVLGVFPITWWTIDDDDDDDEHRSHHQKSGSSSKHHGDSSSSSSVSSSSHSSPTSSSSSSSSFGSSSSPSSSSSSTNYENQASRSSARSAASVSAASARASAASIAKKQSLSKASARSESLASKESAASSHSSASQSSHSSATHSTASSTHSSSSSSASTSSQDTSTSRSSSNDDDPRAGNLENFVKVLNGLSMLVHAAAQGDQE